MNAEFFSALEQLEKEKGISQKYMLEKIELALQSAFKREYGATALMHVDIDADKKKMRAFLQKEVVEEVEDPICQISLEDARAINRGYELGSMVEKEVKTDSMHRLSAAAAKSVIIQGIREGERQAMQEAYDRYGQQDQSRYGRCPAGDESRREPAPQGGADPRRDLHGRAEDQGLPDRDQPRGARTCGHAVPHAPQAGLAAV